ncbi:hypothetical protein [Paenibacillus illinoisensis]|uniref:hypothetical protein n=1 Tax=Paenibacillus illinoisensis TaxID=59845 RepID=UPI00203C0053|nr:hypothetical protein [Paenibacillus illinoisensis]MCM3206410.1 hypothetical protein [Paenibacillus illinoisensis]
MKMRKKLFSSLLATIMLFSSVSAASASPNEEQFPNDLTVPEGFKVVKEYDTTDESNKVDMQVEGRSFSPDTNTFSTSQSITSTEEVDYEILTNETYIYRDLENIETGETVTQYKTDMVVAADPSYHWTGTNTNGANTIKLTITLYYHTQTKDRFVYVGLDKAYYRYDKGSNWNINNAIPSGYNSCELLQMGPGIDTKAKKYKSDCSQLGGAISFGKTFLATAPSGWVDVLEGGLATEVGIKVEASFLNQSNSNKVFNYGWDLRLKGKSPI